MTNADFARRRLLICLATIICSLVLFSQVTKIEWLPPKLPISNVEVKNIQLDFQNSTESAKIHYQSMGQIRLSSLQVTNIETGNWGKNLTVDLRSQHNRRTRIQCHLRFRHIRQILNLSINDEVSVIGILEKSDALGYSLVLSPCQVFSV